MIASPQTKDISSYPYKPCEEDITMRGDIYSREACPICGGKYRNDSKKRALICPNHPNQRAISFYVQFGRTQKRFRTYDKADRFLNGVRYETDKGNFDPRDYKKDNPLGFETLADQFIEFKKGEIKSLRSIEYHLKLATAYWHDKNIKTIRYAEFEDFLLAKTKLSKEIVGHLSSKSRANIKTTLHSMWVWLQKREVITRAQFPEFPKVDFTLGWRKLVDKETQQTILEEIKRISARNPKIYLGIKWLSTYFSIRPSEMLSIKEGDFDFHLGGVLIRQPKEKTPKFVPFLPEDLAIVKSYPSALPHLYFFRHGKGWGGVTPGSKMGRDCLWKAWHKACLNLGIQGVDLYGGTKHSSITDLKKYFSPEKIKKASRISSNKAIDRYLQFELADSVEIYQKSGAVKAQLKITPINKGKHLK